MRIRHPRTIRLIALLLPLVLFAGCGQSAPTAQPPTTAAATSGGAAFIQAFGKAE